MEQPVEVGGPKVEFALNSPPVVISIFGIFIIM